jgi:hypothetical protein
LPSTGAEPARLDTKQTRSESLGVISAHPHLHHVWPRERLCHCRHVWRGRCSVGRLIHHRTRLLWPWRNVGRLPSHAHRRGRAHRRCHHRVDSNSRLGLRVQLWRQLLVVVVAVVVGCWWLLVERKVGQLAAPGREVELWGTGSAGIWSIREHERIHTHTHARQGCIIRHTIHTTYDIRNTSAQGDFPTV